LRQGGGSYKLVQQSLRWSTTGKGTTSVVPIRPFFATALAAEVKIMRTRNDSLQDRLSRSQEINITVTGRTSGRTITIPIWFVFEDGKLYLLPVKGSDTQWYKNVLQNPNIKIDARGAEAELQANPITDRQEVSSVIEKFRGKYAGDVKKYYSKFDVAVVADVR